MPRRHALTASAAILAIALAACSPAPAEKAETPAPSTSPAPAPAPAPSSPPSAPVAGAKVIGLDGLGDLRIGQPPPAGGSWAELGAQASDSCRIITSPDYPGVHAIVEGGVVRRITVGQRSDVKLAEGVGVGATEAEVKSWFGGFRETPHKYQAAPAKYLTAPNAASGDPAVRFEIGTDGKVSLIHVGTMPVLGYVEGCS